MMVAGCHHVSLDSAAYVEQGSGVDEGAKVVSWDTLAIHESGLFVQHWRWKWKWAWGVQKVLQRIPHTRVHLHGETH
eukprot:3927870-Rhodomonas_salina.1